MQGEKYIPGGQTDVERLKDAMEQLKSQHFVTLDESVFADASLAELFNEMTDSLADANNRLVMRLNDSMIRIADNTTIKELVRGVNDQKKDIEEIKAISDHLYADNIDNIEIQYKILSLVRQASATLQPIYDEVENFGIAEAEGRRDDAGIHFNRAMSYLDTIREQIGSLREAVNFYCVPDEVNDAVFLTLKECISRLMLNYTDIIKATYNNGRRLYRISREIDGARSDTYRANSRVSLIDKTKVFSADHLILTWRIFNHILEYERLKIEQVNNPDRCKFGLWCASIEIDVIRESDAFKRAMDAHNTLHEHNVNAFLLNEEGDRTGALEEFGKALVSWEAFDGALTDLAEVMRSNGYTEETEVWKMK